ncbi:MAG TPA: pectin acetylesterase-family hydrolase, partial [Polyangiaceae bacterium]|nr:pectin acetylesterase-family hydrolase [Polyangiaceae bacterium]
DEVLFRQELAALQASGLLDRADGATPFSAANFVVVPYCTGDLFVGEAVRDYSVGVSTRTVHHVGGNNVRAVLADLAERFPATRQIWLTGVSAGGYGALFSYELVAAAFPEARVDVLVDGSPLIEPTGGLLGTWRSQWQAQQPDCAGCDTSLAAVAASLHAAHPDRRFALLTSQNDEVIRSYFGYGLTDITPQIDALAADEYDQAQAHAFVVPGTEHVLLGGYRTRSGPNGSLLRDFVDGWAHGDERFVTVRP